MDADERRCEERFGAQSSELRDRKEEPVPRSAAAELVEIEETAEAKSDLGEPGVGNGTQLTENRRPCYCHQAMQAKRRRNSQPGRAEVRVTWAEGNICVQPHRLCAAGNEGNHDVAVRADGFSKTNGRTHLGTGEVVEGKREEYDFAARSLSENPDSLERTDALRV